MHRASAGEGRDHLPWGRVSRSRGIPPRCGRQRAAQQVVAVSTWQSSRAIRTRISARNGAVMSTTRVSRIIRAPRAAIYRAMLDPTSVEKWRVPKGMTCEVHAFDARQGGAFRVSLTYLA